MISISGGLSFACPPECGWYILNSLHRMGVSSEQIGEVNEVVLIPFSKERNGELLRVSCVMHPCDWIREAFVSGSIFQYMDYPTKDFDLFITWILQVHRGIVGGIFSKYEADTVLRVEDFPWNMIELMDSIGYDKSLIDHLRKVPSYESRCRNLPPWSEWMLREFKEAEKEVRDTYDYF